MTINITTKYENRRILLVDDNPSIHEDFRRILCKKANHDDLSAAEAELFGGPEVKSSGVAFETESAFQGRDALTLVQQSVENGTPFAMAFVDVRMPPGWDGVETVERIWKVDPRLQVVICTAFSDHSWQQIVERLGQSDQFLILKKPFDTVEAQQIALTLTTKWNMARSMEGYQAALEAAVDMKTRQLTKARISAEAASRDKSRSLADLTQEIHAPMRDIVQFARGLLNHGDISKAPQARIEAIQKILQNGQNLLSLVTDIRDFSSLEAGTLALEHVDFNLRDVVEQTLGAHKPAATDKGLHLSWSIDDAVPDYVVGDPSRTGQILSNLVSNAVKFTDQGSVTVRVSVESEQDAACIVQFNVTDMGIGIPMEQMDGVFSAFAQVDSSARKSCGTGLGLAISKRLAEMHGGSIGLSSAPGEGSTFWFTVELKRQPCHV